MRNQRQPSTQAIQRTSRAKRAALDDMRVDHGSAHVGMPQEMLDRGMPHIIGKKSDRPAGIRSLGEKEMATSGMKERIARIFDKNSFRHIFSS